MFCRIVSTAALLSLGFAAELDGGFNIGVPGIPANCISWNDGCNTCRVVNGVIGGCTMMMCQQQGAPFCVAYDYSAAAAPAATPPTVSDKPTPAVVTDTAPTSFCQDSRPQMCRMMCQPASCPIGQCAMRTDSCCEFTCQAPTERVLDGGFAIGVPAPGQATTPTAGYNCCGGGATCGFEHCPALGAGQAGCVQRWAMPNGMNFDTDCAAPAATPPTVSDKPTPAVVTDTAPTSFCQDSRPQMCRMMCQPASCPIGQCAMRTDSCCEFTCQAPTERVLDGGFAIGVPAPAPEPARAATIPAGCVSWHDGCNTCMVQDGQISACTMMMCFEQATPHCLAFDRDHRH